MDWIDGTASTHGEQGEMQWCTDSGVDLGGFLIA
jgi:hypothetical protein